jgi:predicted nucleic acid-binding Zn ribbon protein
MSANDRNDARLDNLKRYRGRKERDMSLHFMSKDFKQQVERPFKQLQTIVPLWEELVPVQLADHTRLESLSRGTLRVSVDSSARLYELDQLLRGGLQRELITRHKGPAFRKIQLKVVDFNSNETDH